MDPRHLDELAELEGHYWWHRSRWGLVEEMLQRYFPAPGLLVEGGVGAGGNLLAFRERGYTVRGFDQLVEAVARCHELGLDEVSQHDLCAPWPVEPGSARVVVLLDTLEHLDEPVEALKQAHQALRADGGVVLTVPAHPWLMGPWDEQLGHKRRYTRRELRAHAEAAGFTVERMSGWNAVTMPAAIAVRVAERARGSTTEGAEFPRVPALVNATLTGLGRIQRSVVKRVDSPVGLSLLAVLKR